VKRFLLFLVLLFICSNAVAYTPIKGEVFPELVTVHGDWEWAGSGSSPGNARGIPDGKIVRLLGNEIDPETGAYLIYRSDVPFNVVIPYTADIHLSTGAWGTGDEGVWVSKDGRNWVEVPYPGTSELVYDEINAGDITNDTIPDTIDVYRSVAKLSDSYTYVKIGKPAGASDPSIEVDTVSVIPVSLGDENSEYILEVNGIACEGMYTDIYVKPGDTITVKVFKRGSFIFKDYVGNADIYVNGELYGRIPPEWTFWVIDNPFDSPQFTFTLTEEGDYAIYGVVDGVNTTSAIIHVGQSVSKNIMIDIAEIKGEARERVDGYEILFGTEVEFIVYNYDDSIWNKIPIYGWWFVEDWIPASGAKILIDGVEVGTTDSNGRFEYTFTKPQGELYHAWIVQAEKDGAISNPLRIYGYESFEEYNEWNETGAYLKVFVGTQPEYGSLYMPLTDAQVQVYKWDSKAETWVTPAIYRTSSNGTVTIPVPANTQLKVIADAWGYVPSEAVYVTLLEGEKKSVSIILKPIGDSTPYDEFYLNAKPVGGGIDYTVPVGGEVEFWISKNRNSWSPEVGGTLHVLLNGTEVITKEIPAPNVLGFGGKAVVAFENPGEYVAYADVDGVRTKNQILINVLTQSDYDQYTDTYYIVADKNYANVGEEIEAWITRGQPTLDKSASVSGKIYIYRVENNQTVKWKELETTTNGFFIWSHQSVKFTAVEPGMYLLEGEVGGVKTKNNWKIEVGEGTATDPNAIRIGWKLTKIPDDGRSTASVGLGAGAGAIIGAILGGGIGAIPGAIVGGYFGNGIGWIADQIDDWFKEWQYGDSVLQAGTEVEFAIIQGGELKTGEIYINGEKIAVLNNNSVRWNFASPGEYEIRAYCVVGSEKSEAVNSPVHFTVAASGAQLFTKIYNYLPAITGIPLVDIIICVGMLLVVIAIIRAVLGGD